MNVRVVNRGETVQVTWAYDDPTAFMSAVAQITEKIENMKNEPFNFLFEPVINEYIRLGLASMPQTECHQNMQPGIIDFKLTSRFCSITMPRELRLHGLFVFLGKTDVQFFCRRAKKRENDDSLCKCACVDEVRV